MGRVEHMVHSALREVLVDYLQDPSVDCIRFSIDPYAPEHDVVVAVEGDVLTRITPGEDGYDKSVQTLPAWNKYLYRLRSFLFGRVAGRVMGKLFIVL